MAISRKAFLWDIICVEWLDHCIAPEVFISDCIQPNFCIRTFAQHALSIAKNDTGMDN